LHCHPPPRPPPRRLATPRHHHLCHHPTRARAGRSMSLRPGIRATIPHRRKRYRHRPRRPQLRHGRPTTFSRNNLIQSLPLTQYQSKNPRRQSRNSCSPQPGFVSITSCFFGLARLEKKYLAVSNSVPSLRSPLSCFGAVIIPTLQPTTPLVHSRSLIS